MKNTEDIGQVCSIWKPTRFSPSQSVLVMKRCVRGRIVPFYGMREFIVSEEQHAKKAMVKHFPQFIIQPSGKQILSFLLFSIGC